MLFDFSVFYNGITTWIDNGITTWIDVKKAVKIWTAVSAAHAGRHVGVHGA
jgi:hypothetical protein